MKKRNVSIQLLRVFACIMVFIVHFGQRVNLSGVLRNFSDFGKYGVQLFFLISGYLACQTFLDNPNVSLKTYYKKRAIAILPLYYLVILYYFISENILNQFVSVIPDDTLGIGWFRYVFILNGFLNSDTYFWSNLGITWTIPIFISFYLIAPWVFRKINTVFSSIITWITVFIITRICCSFYYCTVFENLHILFLGAVIYICVKRKCFLQAIVAFSISAICMIIMGNKTLSFVSIFSCIILALISIDDIHLPNIFQRTIDILDKYSYTLYLMHGVVFCSLIDRLNSLGVSKILIAVVAIIGTFIATWVVGKFIEKPIQKLLKKRFL